ncbi:Uncharacterised protein [Chlamydia trachomatis]|nr:Uncharacterised protein [Chlamydia trachomatis]
MKQESRLSILSKILNKAPVVEMLEPKVMCCRCSPIANAAARDREAFCK